MRKRIIIANWKSNPATAAEAVFLAQSVENGISKSSGVQVVMAPPFPFLREVGLVLKKSRLGAQNSFWGNVGPYTGEISWHQLKHLRAEFVILGHSERRFYAGETDEMINKKVLAVLNHGMRAILCIGEQERVEDEIPAVVGEQLKNALHGAKKSTFKNLIVAYEPVWAISTTPGARADTPDSAFRAAVYIRKILSGLYGRPAANSVRVIYGGSVNSKNIGLFLKEGKMEGALVGGASLNPQEFIKIIKAADTK